MSFPQSGIFALGDSAHIFLELSALPGISPRGLIAATSRIHEPRTTVGGVNFVIGFRPELWRSVAPQHTPADARGFDRPMRGPDGFEMPATQADLWLWFAGASYDIVWDSTRYALAQLRDCAAYARELDGWAYRHSRDLTGFEDGTENPTLMDAPQVALVPGGMPGEGASILLFQQWRHEHTWAALRDEQQEAIMGRTKAESREFDESAMPVGSHVERAKDLVDGEERRIFRRNLPYGNAQDYGTIFVGFSAEQSRLTRMLLRMTGIEDGIRDALTRYTTPLTGAFYVVPSADALRELSEK